MPKLTMVFWDVQHGNAAYLRTPNSTHIVVDLGVGSYGKHGAYFSPLLHLKNQWGVRALDLVIISHPHRDHLDDIVYFDDLIPRVLLRPTHLSEDDIRSGNRSVDKDIIDKYLEVHRRYNQPVTETSDPLSSTNNGGVEIQYFVPTSCSRSNLNNHSIVTIVSYAGKKILIPGDNEPPSWEELLARKDFLMAIEGTDILVAPHHGRVSGFCSTLFEHIEPKLTIISDGRFCDTSATDRYSAKSSGCEVRHRNGRRDNRKCVTTRNDGVIVVEFEATTDGYGRMSVTID